MLQKRYAIQDLILQLHLQQQPDSDFPIHWQQRAEERLRVQAESEAVVSEAVSSAPLLVAETPPKTVGSNHVLVLYTPSPTLS